MEESGEGRDKKLLHMCQVTITIGYAPHRVEVLGQMAREMEGHDLIILEEPPDPWFKEVLAGRMTVDAYVDELVPAFPEFTRSACLLLQRLYRAGRLLIQVEPYLETMERIYDLLDNQGVPAARVRAMPGVVGAVYLAESRTTKALFNFYGKMGGHDFHAAVTACREFARADAARLRLRARLRAEAIAARVHAGDYRGRIYVEAGYLHLALFVFLRQELKEKGIQVRPRFLLAEPLAHLAGPRAPRQLLAPGDVLTLRAVFHAPTSRKRAELLAAQAIIYSALLGKREKVPSARVPYPHLAEELRLLSYVRNLDYEACEASFHKYLRKYSL
ncbi:MAG: hypothetical protein ACUVRF_07835 [Desulfotomaculales bacterium]